MPYNNTTTPTKPTCKPKYQVPMRPHPKMGVMEYYLTPELEQEFRRLFPITFNRRMMELFGLSFATLQRFKRELGLTKHKRTIIRKQAEVTKRICEKNGWYDSLRGKAPSEAAKEGLRRKFAEGWHPYKTMRRKNPRKYKRLMQEMSEQRKALVAREHRRIDIGLQQQTNLCLVQCQYTRSETQTRSYAKHKYGYIPGSRDESSGERHIIFYDKDTRRSPRFEQLAQSRGFEFRPVRGYHPSAARHIGGLDEAPDKRHR